MEFALEKLNFDELKELFELHYKEVGSFQGLGFEPNYEAMRLCDSVGMVRYYTVRVDKVLVGYNLFTVMPDMFHKSHKSAGEVALFIHPEYRGEGLKFIKFVDQNLDVDIIYRATKTCFDFGFVLRRAGYALVDNVYGKLK